MRTYSRTLKTASIVTLAFFLWSFGPIYAAVAYAAEGQGAAKVRSSELEVRNVTPQPGERFEKALDAIRENVSRAGEKADRGEDNAKELVTIKAKRAEIESADIEFKKEFAVTEKKLKDAKLPQEILDRHAKFVKHYEDNLKELKTNLDDVEQAKTKSDRKAKIEKARLHLEKVKAPSKHQKLDPNNLPFKTRKAGKKVEPRLKKEDFERDFPKQKSPIKNKMADIRSLHALLANVPKQKPILLAFNEYASDVPFTLPLPSGERTEVRGGFDIPQLAFADSSPFLLAQATGQPTVDELAETPEVQFTDAIRAKAQELGSAPNIFAWVRNNIKYEPYYGSLKGAQQTLLEGAGNDFDQASLLIAFLRGINIPAKYVYGTVEIPIERVTSWLGVTDPIVAGTILSTNGMPATLMKTSSGVYKTVRLEHCWVSAFVNMLPSFGAKNNPGNMWIPLDPSFKENKITTNIDLSKIAKFNETSYLSNRSSIPPSLSYLFAAEDYHTANYTGKIFEIFYLKRIIEENFEVFLGTLPYQIITTAQQFSEVPDTVRHKININLTDPAMGATVTIQKNVAEITGKKITVSYNPASQEDEATISNYGGLLKTPAYLIKIKPTVKLDNSVILEDPAVNLGASLKLSVNFIEPGMSTENIEADISAGIYYCIGIAALNPSQYQLSGKLDTLRSLSGSLYDSVNMRDDQIGELLHGISIEYFSKANNAAKSLASLMHIQNTNITSGGFASVSVAYANVFGIPSSPATITGLNLDVQRYMQSPFSITGDNDQRKEFAQIQGLNSSFFEHSIMEMLTGLESISAVKALQIASETSVPIYKITASNINEVLPILTVSQAVKMDIQNAINAEKEVTISRDNVRLNDWAGAGFIVRDPNTGAGSYMISGGLAGVEVTQPVSALMLLLLRRIAALAEGKTSKLWMTAENEKNFEYDMNSMINVGNMLLGKGFIPRIQETYSKQEFLNLANDKDNWIFYYSGHGGGDENESWLVPLPGYFGSNIGADYSVFPSNVLADTKITFLNSCSSASTLGFYGAFGNADQMHNGEHRNEVFLGWDKTVDWEASSEFGFNWWRNMFDGMTAEDAALNADQVTDTEFTNYETPGPKLVKKGNLETRL